MNPGSQVAIDGKATTMASSATSATLKGSTPRNTVPIVRWRSRLFTTKMFIPTGGLIKPICTTITMMMPNQTGSKPSAVTTGKKSGTVRRSNERAPGADSRALGRGEDTGIDPADHDEEQQDHRPYAPDRFEAQRPGAALARRAGPRIAPGHPRDGEAQEQRRHDARKNSGSE